MHVRRYDGAQVYGIKRYNNVRQINFFDPSCVLVIFILIFSMSDFTVSCSTTLDGVVNQASHCASLMWVTPEKLRSVFKYTIHRSYPRSKVNGHSAA